MKFEQFLSAETRNLLKGALYFELFFSDVMGPND